MPTIAHEAPLELLHRNPRLAQVLMASLGVAVPPDATAQMVSADLTASLPAEFRADAVVSLLDADEGGRLVVIIEVQLRYDDDKVYTWPAYVTQARAKHRCPAVLLVICPDTGTAGQCRATIATGHPGFDLAPLVIDAATTPLPGQPGTGPAGPELAVLGVLTGALDLDQDPVRRQVLAQLAGLDEDRLRTYTVFILTAASPAASKALEALMSTKFTHPFIEQWEAKGEARGEARGEAKGEARMILRVLSARGMQVPAAIRERVLACTDTTQLDAWGDRAATAASIEEVFDG